MPGLQPVGTKTILEIVSQRDNLQSGTRFFIPEKVTEGEPNMGRVYAIGTDVPAERQYKIGDTVVFHSEEIFQGFRFEDKKLIGVEHADMIAIISEAKA